MWHFVLVVVCASMLLIVTLWWSPIDISVPPQVPIPGYTKEDPEIQRCSERYLESSNTYASRPYCYAQLAAERKDPSICEGDPKMTATHVEACYRHYAGLTGDIVYCMGESRWQCISGIATTRKIPSLCDLIPENSTFKRSCESESNSAVATNG